MVPNGTHGTYIQIGSLQVAKLTSKCKTIMNGPTSSQVLGLYRNLMRYGKQLQFTDKTYFVDRIRKEFKKKKDLTEIEDIKFQYERGVALLKNRRVV